MPTSGSSHDSVSQLDLVVQPDVIRTDLIVTQVEGHADQGLALQYEDALQRWVLVDHADVDPYRARELLDGVREEIGARTEEQVSGLDVIAYRVVTVYRELLDLLLADGAA